MNQDTQENHPKWLGFSRKSWIRFFLAAVLYALFIFWVGSPWLLLGFPVLFDVYVSHLVNWSPWRPKNKKPNAILEWMDALIFAVIAVTLVNLFVFQNYRIPSGSMEKSLLIGDHLYVSKLRFGPKMPNTPLSFPFAQHTLPLTVSTPSYLEWIQWPYKRLKGFASVKNDDNVVFNFPEGDTVVVEMQAESYYSIVRRFAALMQDEMVRAGDTLPVTQLYGKARKYLQDNYEIVVRPLDKKENYIKRCVAIPGDRLEIRHGQVFINDKPQKSIPGIQYDHRIATDGTAISDRALEKIGIYKDDLQQETAYTYLVPLTESMVESVRSLPGVKAVDRIENPDGNRSEYIFPHHPAYAWNEDNFGPLAIPAKGQTLPLNTENLCLYERIISVYEGRDLKVEGETIYIDGKPVSEYTFAMDYYFMMGDNRHHSADSRYWGMVPEDHIVGSPVLVWLSLDKEKSFPLNIRLGRFFTGARR